MTRVREKQAARRACERRVSADDVATWLQAAGVAVPLGDPKARAAAAQMVNDHLRAHAAWADMQTKDAKTARAFDEAHKAVLDLRRTLPTVLARYAAAASAPSLVGGEEGQREMAQRTAEVARMLTALVDVPKWPAALPFMHDWHDLAAGLFLDFQRITGKGSTSKNGPAVRFICEGLKAAGITKSASAVEGALGRSDALMARAVRKDSKAKTSH